MKNNRLDLGREEDSSQKNHRKWKEWKLDLQKISYY